jgi:hypothetical protein
MTDNNARRTLINQVGAVFVPVADQDRALGFEKRADFTYGEDSRWMEVAPPGAANTLADSSVAEGPRILQVVWRIAAGLERVQYYE